MKIMFYDILPCSWHSFVYQSRLGHDTLIYHYERTNCMEYNCHWHKTSPSSLPEQVTAEPEWCLLIK